MSTTNVSELGYLFLTLSSLHKIESDLDVRDHSCWMMFNPLPDGPLAPPPPEPTALGPIGPSKKPVLMTSARSDWT